MLAEALPQRTQQYKIDHDIPRKKLKVKQLLILLRQWALNFINTTRKHSFRVAQRDGRDSSVGIATTLPAGRSGILTPAKARSSATVQYEPEATQPPIQWVPSLFHGGKAAGA